MLGQIDDLYKWSKILGTGKLLTRRTFEEQIARTTVGLGPNKYNSYYGLGIGVNNGWLGHAGSCPGFSSYTGYNLTFGYQIAVMVGTDIEQNNGNLAELIARNISNILTPIQPIQITKQV